MREIVVRNLTSGDWRKRDCVITERLAQGTVTTTVVRRCTYRVEAETILPCMEDSVAWAQRLDPAPPREVFVRKHADPETGGERVIYKVRGHFYVVWGDAVYRVGYRHVLVMDVGAESYVPDDMN
ncbi:MAG TPA: hypothetical protein VGB20_03690 [bacterium]